MTTKQIAEATGKDERTIQRWVKSVGDKMSGVGDKMSASTSSHPADYDLEETVAIIRHGMGANAADLYRMSARPEPTGINFQALVESAIRGTIAALRAEGILPAAKPAQIEAPSIAPRDELRRIVNRYVKTSGESYGDAWGLLYTESYYRLHINFTLRAKNEGRPALDIVEETGNLPAVVAIAREVMG